MKKQIIYLSLLFLAITSCEEIYNPHLNVGDKYLVIEAKLYANNQHNQIRLYKSKSIEDTHDYERISGATITLTDDKGVIINAIETETAGTYSLDYMLDQNRSYYISVQTGGEDYQSEYQSVPEIPSIDTVYGAYGKYIYTRGTSNSTDNIVTKNGVRLYADMSNNGKTNFYRFDGRMIMQYILEGIRTYTYGWKSYYPLGLFNIAGPAEYGTQKNIVKHPLEFFNNNFWDYIINQTELKDSFLFEGWIYIIDQYGINENTYNYYNDLNSQLNANGKIFDPVYLQIEGNIKCISNPDVVVLGNFEIVTHKEYRYFLYMRRDGQWFELRQIPYFYDITEEGRIIWIQNGGIIIDPFGYGWPPNFWENI